MASASSFAASRTEFVVPRCSLVAAITGANSGVETVASSTFSLLTPVSPRPGALCACYG
jgi:hypothetical protein